ncbi:MAG: hypothetical protein HY900_37540 [Deltaproteobacteria bacterium]|nr:hypothetical protein [Deltaproteobacteria bacterium]
MATICGEVKTLESPTGGGVYVSETEYTDGTRKTNWYKSRMVFPVVQIGDSILKKVFVANDQLGNDIAKYIHQGEQVCLYVYGHLLRKKVIIGVKSNMGSLLAMPARGFESGLFWYAIFSPIIVALPAAALGMLVGMVGGQRGTAMGLLLGVLYAVGISWLSGFRFFQAYREMRTTVDGLWGLPEGAAH